MNNLKRFILVGGPGSGKGTQARFLSERFHLDTLSTGALLRREIESCSETGKRAQGYMDKAQFVPDEIVNEVVKGWLANTGDEAWLLDGYPRTLSQAETLDHFMEQRGLSVDCVVWLDVARELIEERILRRRECENCHFVVQEPLETCPRCGGKMVVRKDDNLEAFARRWKDYEDMTLPVARYYEAKGVAVKVSVTTERQPEDVSRELLEALNSFASHTR